jgi:hypothetical protein
MFYGSGVLAMIGLRVPTTLVVGQSNQIVYQAFTATITISNLAIGDIIKLSTLFGSYFYPNNQTNCSTAIATCNAGGILTVTSINNNGSVTSMQVVLTNQAYIGSY